MGLSAAWNGNHQATGLWRELRQVYGSTAAGWGRSWVIFPPEPDPARAIVLGVDRAGSGRVEEGPAGPADPQDQAWLVRQRSGGDPGEDDRRAAVGEPLADGAAVEGWRARTQAGFNRADLGPWCRDPVAESVEGVGGGAGRGSHPARAQSKQDPIKIDCLCQSRFDRLPPFDMAGRPTSLDLPTVRFGERAACHETPARTSL